MNTRQVLVRMLLQRVCNANRTLPPGKALQIGATVLAAVLFVLLAYVLLSIFLSFLRHQPPLGPVLIPKLLHLSLLACWVLLVLAVLIGTLSASFLAVDLELLFALPIRTSQIYWYTHWRSVVCSSWTVLILLLPMLLAYGHSGGAEHGYWVYLIPATAVYGLSAAGVGATLAIAATRWLNAARTRWVAIGAGIGACAAFGLTMQLLHVQRVPMLDRVALIDRAIGIDAFWTDYLPSAWMARGLSAAAAGVWADAFFFLAMLAFTALAVHLPCTWMATENGIYYRAWACASAIDTVSRRARCLRRVGWRGALLNGLPADAVATLAKDLRIWTRDVVQWAQFGVLLALVIVYVTNAGKLPVANDHPFWNSVLVVINVAMTGIVLATFALRFLFPYVSMEGDAAWVTWMSPMPVRRFLAVKVFFGLSVLLVLGHIVMAMANASLRIPAATQLLTHSVVTCLAFGLTGLCIGLGAVFPRFDLRRAVDVASSGGGLLAMLIALLYVAAMVVCTVWALHPCLAEATGARYVAGDVWWAYVGLAAMTSIGCATAPVIAGGFRLRRMEF